MSIFNSIGNFVVDNLGKVVNLPLDIIGRFVDLPFGLSNGLVLDLVKVSGTLLNYIDLETLLDIAEGSVNGNLNLIDLFGDQVSQIGFNELMNLVEDAPSALRTISSLNFDQVVTLPTLLEGKEGNDYLAGADSGDIINGKAGNDELQGKRGSDVLYGDAGNDTILGQKGYDILNGEDGDDLLDGAKGNDILTGGAGNDTLLGGLTGNDILNGGAGKDILTGGNSRDYFVFGSSTGFGVDLADEITDFASLEQDKIILDPEIFTNLVSVQGNGFSVISEFAVVNSEDLAANSIAKIVYNSSTGGLYYNVNGNEAGFGTGGQFANLTNKAALTATDFIIGNDSITTMQAMV
ncbi:MAG: calcium-binding protein [Microcoleaceae cyanobacterium]